MSNFCTLLPKMTPFLKNVQYIKFNKSKFFVGRKDRILWNPILVTPWYTCAKMWHVHFLSRRTLGLAPSLAAPWTRKSISIGKKVLSQSTWQQSFSSRSKVTLMLSSLQTRTYLFLRFLLTSDLINVSKLLIFEVSTVVNR